MTDTQTDIKRGRGPRKPMETDVMMETLTNTSQATGNNLMHVRFCHPGPASFALKDKRVVTINGSNIGIVHRGVRTPLRVGEFGKTIIPASDWDQIVGMYGHKAMFKNGFIAAFDNEKYADGWVAERCGQVRHGLDPVDTTTTLTKQKNED